MANRTDPLVKSIHGTKPENLLPKIVRTKIQDMRYWKEHCFGLTAETLLDKAIELDHIGGTFGCNRKPTPFLCLVLKMLQIQPENEIVLEIIKNEPFKYVRVLGAFYLRLRATEIDVYRYLEPLYNDYRKLRRKLADGGFALTHVDEVVEELLTSEYWCDIVLPRIKKRETMWLLGLLEPRKSTLEDEGLEEETQERVLKAYYQTRRRRRRRRRRRSTSRERDEARRHERVRERDNYHRLLRQNRDLPSFRWGCQLPSPGRNHENHCEDGIDIAASNRIRAALGMNPLEV